MDGPSEGPLRWPLRPSRCWLNLIVLTGSQSSGRGSRRAGGPLAPPTRWRHSYRKRKRKKKEPVCLLWELVWKNSWFFNIPMASLHSCLCVIVVILPALCCCSPLLYQFYASVWLNMGNIVRSYRNSREVSLDSCVFGCVCARVCLCSAVVVV